jgi:cyclopropane-fatty-acyl-phospholipid synthase
MNREAARGGVLLEGGRRFGRTPRLLSRLFAGGFHKLLDRIDEGLGEGSILAKLPDGSTRLLGGRAEGIAGEVEIRDWRALLRLTTGGSVGWYQAWEAGEWASPDPVQLFALFMTNGESLGEFGRAKGLFRLAARFAHWLNRNTRSGAEKNIHVHYDLGNDFYAAWLDPTMSYSSAYQVAGDGLEAAQKRKWARLAERLGTPDTLLEIGCGWGGLSNVFTERGSAVTAISLSDEQLAWCRERYPEVDFRKQDYRDCAGQYDAVVSVEMVEALGREYWPTFMDCLARNLKPGGRAAIQFIAMRDELFEGYARNADFIQAYVFPGGLLIKTSEFRRLAEERGLSWQDQEDFPLDYAETLKAWRANFDAAARDGRLPAGFDERFRNLWRFYLMYCEGGFRGGGITVSQVTLVKA